MLIVIFAVIPTYCRFILILSSHLRPSLPRSLFPVNFLSILVTCPAHPILLNVINLKILCKRTNNEVPHCEAFFTPQSQPFWTQLPNTHSLSHEVQTCSHHGILELP